MLGFSRSQGRAGFLFSVTLAHPSG
jgi:hypothetical protein